MASAWQDVLDSPPFRTTLRVELVRWLDDHAPSFTAGYVGAVQLLYNPSFPARVHLVCHLVRDIYRYLPAALGTKPLPRSGDVLPSMVGNLVDQWDKFPPNGEARGASTESDVSVSPQVYRRLSELVAKYRGVKAQPSQGHQLATALFRSMQRREDEFLDPWITNSFQREYIFFVSRAHLAQRVEKVPTDDGLEEHFVAFERSFHSLVGPYFTGKQELDEILRDTNPSPD